MCQIRSTAPGPCDRTCRRATMRRSTPPGRVHMASPTHVPPADVQEACDVGAHLEGVHTPPTLVHVVC